MADFNIKKLLKHKGDGWIAILGRVYDVSSFVDQHPGGSEVIEEWYGKDATKSFLDIHPSGDNKLLETWGKKEKDSFYKGMFVDKEESKFLDETTKIVLLFLLISFLGFISGSYVLSLVFLIAGIELGYNFMDVHKILNKSQKYLMSNFI